MHGSAPDIAGKSLANPLGAIASAAMLLRYTAGLDQEADKIMQAVDRTLATRDGARRTWPAGKKRPAVPTDDDRRSRGGYALWTCCNMQIAYHAV